MKIIASAPARIGIIGGGTDVPTFALKETGQVINMAINLRQKLTLYTGDDLYGIKNYFPYNANPDFCYKIFKLFGIDGGHLIKIESNFDGIVGAGLGSSAAFAVALIGAINKAKNLGLRPNQIAESAWRMEVNGMDWYGGKQDQYAAVTGGLNHMTFTGVVHNISLPKKSADKLLPYLSLFYIGGTKTTGKIQSGFKELSNKQIKTLKRIKKNVSYALIYLMTGDIKALGELLDETWTLKKESNKNVTNEKIDDLYVKAKKAGAYGGKIMGAGGCGYMFFLSPPEKIREITKSLQVGEPINFSIDWNGVETRIL